MFSPARRAATTSATIEGPITPPALATPTIMVLAPLAAASSKPRCGRPRVWSQFGPRYSPTQASGRQAATPREVFTDSSSRESPR